MSVLETAMNLEITWKTREDFRVQGIGSEIGVDEEGFDPREVGTLMCNDNRL